MSFIKSLKSIFALRCPTCHDSPLFCNSSLINIKEIDKMPPNCQKCNQDFVIEIGFYYGAMFISYIFTVFSILFVLAISLLLYGTISRTYLYITLFITLFFWTYIFRLSRSIWLALSLYLFPKDRNGQVKN